MKKITRIVKTSKPLVPLWKFEYDDKTTWAYINYHFVGINRVVWVKNPSFKYNHLLRNDRGINLYGANVCL